MTSTRLLTAILVLAGILLWMLFFWDPAGRVARAPDQAHRALGLASKPVGGDFALASARGPVRLEALRGKVVLIYFGYTSCPDVCPTSLAFISSALGQLEEDELAQVQVIFISVDPERDDLDRLAVYTRYFHPKILGATGSPSEIAQVAARYGAVYRRAPASDSAMGYFVDHSAYTYVVDQTGRLVGTLDHATPPDEIRARIRDLLEGGDQDTAH